MPDPRQERLRLRALELLGTSYRMHERGDFEASGRFRAQAVHECGEDMVAVIYAGWRDGVIPMPDGELWGAYLAAARDALEVAEVRAATAQARMAGQQREEGQAND